MLQHKACLLWVQIGYLRYRFRPCLSPVPYAGSLCAAVEAVLHTHVCVHRMVHSMLAMCFMSVCVTLCAPHGICCCCFAVWFISFVVGGACVRCMHRTYGMTMCTPADCSVQSAHVCSDTIAGMQLLTPALSPRSQVPCMLSVSLLFLCSHCNWPSSSLSAMRVLTVQCVMSFIQMDS